MQVLPGHTYHLPPCPWDGSLLFPVCLATITYLGFPTHSLPPSHSWDTLEGDQQNYLSMPHTTLTATRLPPRDDGPAAAPHWAMGQLSSLVPHCLSIFLCPMPFSLRWGILDSLAWVRLPQDQQLWLFNSVHYLLGIKHGILTCCMPW